MCRPCCEYQLIQCRCPSKGTRVGYTVPCCRNALDQCDPCIIHPGCSLFENCKTCHNGTWKANDDFFVDGKYCTDLVLTHNWLNISLDSYPTNARCEWTVQVEKPFHRRFSLLSLEADHSCRYDYVEVRDGDGLTSPVIGRFCGDQLPPPIKSTGNILHILFSSDGYNNFDGFVVYIPLHACSASLCLHAPYLHPYLPFCSAVTICNSTLSAFRNPVCAPPEHPVNGYLLPVFGPKETLISVNYNCYPPFTLLGSRQRVCLPNARWSGEVPACVKECFLKRTTSVLFFFHRENPDKLSSRDNVHDLLSAGFIPLRLDQSKRDDNAFVELPRGFHPVHTSIEYKCASPLYRHSGSSRRTCLKSGRWSGRHVSCSPGANLTDTQWPWHAAIYVRSPPDHTASPDGPQGAAMSVHQGASEESTFWFLACSGALLTQRSILVAAQCVADEDKRQPLQPAQVKVVIDTRSQKSKDRPKGLHHLTVSDISVHPNFYSTPDSNVAVLKLRDKAKISEGVLPVCLPKVQGGEVTAREAYTTSWILPNDDRDLSRSTPSSQTKLVQLGDVAQCEREFAQEGEPVFSWSSAVLSGHDEQGASGTSWQLLGLETFSYNEKKCDRLTHAVQTRIGNFRDWIEKNLK
uniref:Uncharacterized protein n=1 Tax=Mola mola TaxID=94237 RepID=A0A3Q4AVI4_MOLML